MKRLIAPLATVSILTLLAACGQAPEDAAPSPEESSSPVASKSPSAAPTSTPTPTNACAIDPARISLEEKVGYLFMMGRDTTAGPVDETYRLTMQENHIKAVVLLGDTTAGVDGVREIVQGLDPNGDVLVAADQEGGQIQRLQGPGFDTMPSAAEQAEMSAQELTGGAATWGEQLTAAGVDMNLAPVADVVPEEVGADNEPVAALERGYGSDPGAVGRHAAAYVKGMQQGGQLTSVKHFPGLGAVQGNTDFSADVVDDRTAQDDPGLESFRTVKDAGVDSVMVATAKYERIDPENLAAFSPVVIEEMIRGDLGFDKVVISDDMGAAAQVADVTPGERAVRFLAAGGDIVINGDLSIQSEMTEGVLARAKDDPEFEKSLDEKVARISALHEGSCGIS